MFGNAGQDCCARSRILVQQDALERFMELFEGHVRALRVGDPLDETTEMGPLISAAQRDAVASFLDGQYTAWGKVTEGMDNVDKSKRGEPVRDPDKIIKAQMAADA